MSQPTKVLGVRIRPELIEKIDIHVEERGGHRNGTIIRAIERFLEQDKTPTAA